MLNTECQSPQSSKASLLAEVAPELSRLGFEVFLLPSPEHRQVWHSAARFPDNGALQPDAPGGLDDDAIDGLLTEVRQIIGSAKFGVALKVACARLALSVDVASLSEMQGQSDKCRQCITTKQNCVVS